MDVIEIILAVLGSSALFSFLTFLINRKDTRNDTLKEIVKVIKEMKNSNKQQFQETREAINTLRDDMNTNDQKLRDSLDENKAITARVRILRASDEILHKMKHSKEWFDQLNDDITYYETYCNTHPDFRNNKATHAIASIDKVYAKCIEENDFL